MQLYYKILMRQISVTYSYSFKDLYLLYSLKLLRMVYGLGSDCGQYR